MFDCKEFTGWPTGDSKPILNLKREPKELEADYGFKFKREKDDLDWFLGSHFIDEKLGPIVLMQHENSPIPGTTIYVDSGLDLNSSIVRLVEIMKLKSGSCNWKASD